MIEVEENGIRFLEYPFTAATVYPNGFLPVADIKEILPGQYPPEIRTVGGEVLFVHHPFKSELEQFALQHQIPIVSRVDIWDFILEEFLDTEYSEEMKLGTFAVLNDAGLEREEVVELRQSVAGVMMAYNFGSMLWEWVHLGLYDLLNAYSGVMTGDRYKLEPEAFGEFYWKAMHIANKGEIRSSS
ncbi:hypothetical protein ACX93W_27000 [Paenibacillus sp. CAU 1782]